MHIVEDVNPDIKQTVSVLGFMSGSLYLVPQSLSAESENKWESKKPVFSFNCDEYLGNEEEGKNQIKKFLNQVYDVSLNKSFEGDLDEQHDFVKSYQVQVQIDWFENGWFRLKVYKKNKRGELDFLDKHYLLLKENVDMGQVAEELYNLAVEFS